ncbi:MAG: DUF2892 domain-containing protein [Chloroflexi bacterium]|nr:DUF2892 domain-containing protein [Chloroflexota bacterium]MCL5276039.1 DUF2892 domain-containing protein [Chloroflexota bacterium]
MQGLFSFLGSSSGRITRAVAGIVLIALGLFVVGGTGGAIIAVIGLLPLAAGVFDFCLFAPLAGLPFSGEKLRSALQKKMGR